MLAILSAQLTVLRTQIGGLQAQVDAVQAVVDEALAIDAAREVRESAGCAHEHMENVGTFGAPMSRCQDCGAEVAG